MKHSRRPAMATTLASALVLLAAQSPNVLKLHAGDALTGTLYFNHAGQPGQADAALVNTVCFGNSPAKALRSEVEFSH